MRTTLLSILLQNCICQSVAGKFIGSQHIAYRQVATPATLMSFRISKSNGVFQLILCILQIFKLISYCSFENISILLTKSCDDRRLDLRYYFLCET